MSSRFSGYQRAPLARELLTVWYELGHETAEKMLNSTARKLKLKDYEVHLLRLQMGQIALQEVNLDPNTKQPFTPKQRRKWFDPAVSIRRT